MAHSYIDVDRDQQFLISPDMRQWLPPDHLAWFVLDVLEKIETSMLHVRHPNDGVGRRAYNPEMLLAVLIYAYCTGTRSSRDIERQCWSDVAFRVLAANTFPDHTTISRFRKDFRDLAKSLFVQVLVIARAAGAMNVGVVAVDGTKMDADASLKATRDRDQLERSRKLIEAEVEAMFEEADHLDAAQDGLFGDRRGDELPEELRDAAARKQRIDEAIDVMDRRKREGATTTQKRKSSERIAKLEEREEQAKQRLDEQIAHDTEMARLRATKTTSGPAPKDPGGSARQKRARKYYTGLVKRREKAEADAQHLSKARETVNLSDLDSRMMHTARGYLQGYNAQAAVNQDGIVIATLVCNDPTDYGQFTTMINEMEENLHATGVQGPVMTGTVLADAGYLSDDNLSTTTPDRLIATGKSHVMRNQPDTQEPLPENASPSERNEHRLRTPQGRELYKKRQHMIEPVFGHTKHNRGFRQFLQRGLDAVNAEWNLMMTAHNITKLFNRYHG